MKKGSTIREWIKAILLAFITIILIRVFCFEAFTISSSSMEKTLFTGDYVLVNKLSYGPRIPMTLFSMPFAHQRMPFTENTNSYLNWLQLPYKRLFGTPDVKHNDVIMFNYPMEEEHPVDQRIYYIKRCVGIPGDMLEIRKGQVYINSHYNDVPEKLQFSYKVISDKDTVDSEALARIGITEGGKLRNFGEFWFGLSSQNVDSIKRIMNVLRVEPIIEKKGTYSDYMFPEDERFLWNVDFFGPVYVPKAGDSIEMAVQTLPLYKRIINVYENNDVRVSGDSIFINDKYATHYTFKSNYYFMMGDNRHNSADSRFWGFLPESHIVGKAAVVLLSINKTDSTSSIRWDRWFKSIE
ncbi:MAG: signal peptidase I [Bacteroidia bacterium]